MDTALKYIKKVKKERAFNRVKEIVLSMSSTFGGAFLLFVWAEIVVSLYINVFKNFKYIFFLIFNKFNVEKYNKSI